MTVTELPFGMRFFKGLKSMDRGEMVTAAAPLVTHLRPRLLDRIIGVHKEHPG